MTTAEILSFSVGSVAAITGLVALVRGVIRAAAPRPLTVTHKQSGKSITLPAHYTPQAAQQLLELLA